MLSGSPWGFMNVLRQAAYALDRFLDQKRFQMHGSSCGYLTSPPCASFVAWYAAELIHCFAHLCASSSPGLVNSGKLHRGSVGPGNTPWGHCDRQTTTLPSNPAHV